MAAEKQAEHRSSRRRPRRRKRKRGLLDEILNKGLRAKDDDARQWGRDLIKEFVAQLLDPKLVVSKDIEKTIKFWIAQIDKKLSAQLNEIMHHPEFQKLEGSWRGLHYLVAQQRDRHAAQDPGAQRVEEGPAQGPGEGLGIRPERALQEGLRGRVRQFGASPSAC